MIHAILLTVLVGLGTLATGPNEDLLDAARNGDVAAVTAAMEAGADVNAAQGDGMTALHWAAERGHADVARVLLDAGAAVDRGTRIGSYTPLHLASRRGNADMARTLLTAGADPGLATTSSGVTPLHLAAAAVDALDTAA